MAALSNAQSAECCRMRETVTTALTDQYRASQWPLPPRTKTRDGHPRRLGVELEFSGLPLHDIVELMRQFLGGKVETVSPYEFFLRDSSLGDFAVELDFAWLKRRGRERAGEPALDELGQFGESVLKLAAEQVVPFEIVSPPIPMTDLWRLGDLFQLLREAGAQGTSSAPHYAYGLHLNPEMPDLDVATILAYLRAFACLFDWLRERSKVNLSRRITPYIDPFEKPYIRLLLREDYSPTQAQLIDDYLRHNPTRNRALDLLPLFAHLDEQRVRSAVDDSRIKSRPTLHYRLPNCEIDDPNWSLAQPWRDWLQVEALACDPPRLQHVTRQYREHLSGLAGGLFGDWAEASAGYLLPELA
jgi:hypothetical protein